MILFDICHLQFCTWNIKSIMTVFVECFFIFLSLQAVYQKSVHSSNNWDEKFELLTFFPCVLIFSIEKFIGINSIFCILYKDILTYTFILNKKYLKYIVSKYLNIEMHEKGKPFSGTNSISNHNKSLVKNLYDILKIKFIENM